MSKNIQKKMKHKLRNAIAFILAFVMFFNSGTLSYAEETKGESIPDGSNLVKNIQINKNGSTLTSGKCEITNGDELSIQYNLVDLFIRDTDTDKANIADNTKYSFAVPDLLYVNQSESWDLTYKFNGENIKLGEVNYDGNRLVLHINSSDTFKNEQFDKITGCVIGFSVKLDGSQIKNEEENQTISFGSGSTPSFNFTYKDNVKTETIMTKDGSYDATNDVVNWTVTIKPGTKKYEGKLKLVDTFEKNQDYIDGSFKVNGIKVTESSEDVLFEYQENNNQLIYSYTPGTPTKNEADITITYQTRFNQLAYINDDNTVITSREFSTTNKAELYDVRNSKKLASAEKKVSTGETEQLNWVEKTSGVVSYDRDNDIQYITWTLTVDTNGFTFKNLTVIDSPNCKPSNSESKFRVVNDSLKISRENRYNSSIVSKYATDHSESMITASGTDKWSVVLEEGEDKLANGVYTITYQTLITDYSKYILCNQTPVSNDVKLTFEWPGYGTGVYGTPTVTKQAENVQKDAMIGQTYSGYDTTKHQLTWHVVLNSSKQTNMTDIQVVTDTHGQAENLEHSFVAVDNIKVNGGAATEEQKNLVRASKISADTEDEKAVITFCGDGSEASLLNGNKVEFDVITELTEADYYENNTGNNPRKAYHLAQMQLGENNLTAVKSEGIPKVTVLSKSSGGYDYNTHTLTWNIVVNKDLVPMKDVYVLDEIITGKLVTESIKVIENETQTIINTDEKQKYYYSYDVTSKELKIHLRDSEDQDLLTKRLTIQYQVKLDIDEKIQGESLSENNGDIEVSNSAELHNSNSSTKVPQVTASQVIHNELLKKTVTFDAKEPVAHFVIRMNQPQREAFNQLAFTDIMSPGMNLNLPTVRLYKATILADGTFEYDRNDPIAKENYTRQVTVMEDGNSQNPSVGTTEFVFQLPEGDETSPYVMEYDASLDDSLSNVPSNFSNTITAGEIILDDKNTKTEFPNTSLKGWGSGNAVPVSRVRVAVQDDSGKKISGAVIELRYDGQVISRKTTNEDGLCTYSHLDPDAEYEIVQVQTPDGYLLPNLEENRRKEFTALAKGNASLYTNPITLTNERNTVTFMKVNEKDKDMVISGAKFKLCDMAGNLATNVYGEKIQQFTSSESGNQIRGLQNGTYQFIEVSAPNGYVKNEAPYVFTMKDNKMYPGDAVTDEKCIDDNRALVANEQFHVYFRDEDTQGNSFTNAKVALYKASDFNQFGTMKDNASAVKKWTTSEDIIDLATVMQTGQDYVLVQTESKKGYTIASNIAIHVNEDGSYKVDSSILKAAEGRSYICMTNEPLSVSVSLTSALDKISYLAGAKLEVYAAKDVADGEPKANATPTTTWTSEDGSEGNQAVKQLGEQLHAGESYVLVEKISPTRYIKADNIAFELSKSGEITNVKSSDANVENGTIIYVTNIPLIDIAGTVTWVDAENRFKYRPESISLELKKNETIMKEQPELTWVTNGNKWNYVFHDLPACEKNGKEYSYSIASEDTIGEHYIRFYGPEDGTYDLGYKLADFPVAIQKINQAGKGIANAKLELQQIVMIDGIKQYKVIREWTSAKEATDLFLADGEYRLVETKAPNGYVSAEPVNFQVDTNGDVYVNGINVNGKVTMTDPYTETEFSKMIVGGITLKGAILKVTDRDGNDVSDIDGVLVPSWESDGSNHVIFGLADGKYTLHEVDVPNGFAKAEDIAFEIVDGQVKDNNNNRIVMSNKRLSVPFEIIEFGSGAPIEDATIAIFESADVNDFDIVESDAESKAEWISELRDNGEASYDFGSKLKAGKEYCLVETAVPESYVGAKPIRFTIADDGTVILKDLDSETSVTKITMENMPLSDVNGTNLWVDKNNVYRTRPEQVELTLLADGEELETQPDIEWSKMQYDSWNFSFGELPEYNEAGEEVVYSVTAVDIEQYEVSCESLDVTNQLIAGEVKFTVTDQGKENTPIKEAILDFYKQVDEVPDMKKDIVIGEYTTDESGTITIDKVPEGNYYFVVDTIPDGYTFTKEPTGMFEMTPDMIQAGAKVEVGAEIKLIPPAKNPIEKFVELVTGQVETGDVSRWKYMMILFGGVLLVSSRYVVRRREKREIS